MHVFKVVKEPYGWAVRLDSGMTTPFWSRAMAIREANCLCDALRSHGEQAEVLAEELDSDEAPNRPASVTVNRLRMLARTFQAGPHLR